MDRGRPPLVVTTSWDDGHPADLRLAEVLDRYGASGTFYVPCRNVEGRPVLDNGGVAELGRRHEVAGHTRDHIPLTGVDPRLAANQIGDNKRRLEDVLGREITGFAYVRGRHDAKVRDLVDKAGFRYARTVRSFASEPGVDRLQVPTTSQFFAHRRAVLVRNFISGWPGFGHVGVLASALLHDAPTERCLEAAGACARLGGHFHLWGHSWEVEEHDLWDDLDRLLGSLSRMGAVFVTNAAWCSSLTKSAEPNEPSPTPPDRTSTLELDRPLSDRPSLLAREIGP